MEANGNADAIDAPVRDRSLVQALLRTGMGASLVLMASGLATKLVTHDVGAPHVGLFGILGSKLSWGDRLMAMGILVLALTPAFRVLALLILWIRERDWRFVIVAAIVLFALCVAISLGGA